MMRVCFVTYNGEPFLTTDDQLLARYLSGKNIDVSPAKWDDEEINWKGYDAIVLRSMWDYHTQIAKFNTWLNKLEILGCKVLNPVSVVRWNQNKKYLSELSGSGLALPPLHFCSQKSSESLSVIMKANCWDKVVVKPAVSGGSFNTWVTTSVDAELNQQQFDVMLQNSDVIVQKFMDEIITQGELSLMFFNKRFSHAILKEAKQGDFRVQAQFGGTATTVQPNGQVLQYAQALLNNIVEPLLYARVDGIVLNGDEFCLMELELIEPVLWMYSNVSACENFYNALIDLLSKDKQESGCLP